MVGAQEEESLSVNLRSRDSPKPIGSADRWRADFRSVKSDGFLIVEVDVNFGALSTPENAHVRVLM